MKHLFTLLFVFWAGLTLSAQTVVKKTINVNDLSFKMVQVQGGRFNMGGTAEQDPIHVEDDEWPIHVVTLSDYYIGETEVTQALWQEIMGDNPSGFTGDLNCPVERVMWIECQTFVEKLSEKTGIAFRLPTEAEWEFAARGGIYSHTYRYSGSDNIADVAWYGANSGEETHPVAQLQPNELGIYDMSGNVDEWCQDWWGNYDMQYQEDPTGPDDGENRVRRGGDWGGSTKGPRVSYRNYELPNIKWNYIGLRLAATEITDEQAASLLPAASAPTTADTPRYNVLGQPVPADYHGLTITPNEKKIVQ